MHLDPSIVSALVISSAGVLGALAGKWASRRDRHAQVELTEAQTDELQTRVYDRVIARQEAENQELAAKVTSLEGEVALLQERLRHLEQVQDERDVARAEVAQLREQLAGKQAELDAAYGQIEHLRNAVVNQAQAIPPSTL